MTKLTQPIVVTITHVENAVLLMIIGTNRICQGREEALAKNCSTGEVNHALEAALKSQGIDWKTWEPPQPFLFDGHEATFNPDGSMDYDGNKVSRVELEKIVLLSTEAMKQEPEWPRWWSFGDYLYRADNAEDFGTIYPASRIPFESTVGGPLVEYAKNNDFKPLTPLEAKAILEAKQ